jgi:hypothetical protein
MRSIKWGLMAVALVLRTQQIPPVQEKHTLEEAIIR